MTLSQNTKILQDYIKNNSNIEKKSEKEISDIYQQLIDCITDHNHLYYIENNPIISDIEYDQLFNYLKKIEEYFPYMISGNSPTQSLVNQVQDGFEKGIHQEEMLSLENSYNAEDLKDREKKILNILGKEGISKEEIKYYIEPKFDGISIELRYEDGIFSKAITRGDGKIGEIVTENVKKISEKYIPRKLKGIGKSSALISFRGEIIISKSKLIEINKERESEGLQPYSNTRNLAAGSIKQLNTNITAERELQCYIYETRAGGISSAMGKYLDIGTLNEILDTKVEKFGFKTIHLEEFENIDNIVNYCIQSNRKKELNEEYPDIDFDGLVIKIKNKWIGDKRLRDIIGSTAHHPRRAIAYKFPAEQVSTQIISIDFQIGRTGIITPVANLSPVQLSGANISRTTLHNFDFINTKDIRIGDYVRLQRSGEVIPYIVGVIKDKRNGSEITVNPPTKCPVCNSKIINEDIHYYCSSDICPAQIKAKLQHFVSKNCMDIMGIGDSIIDILVDQKIISNIADLFELTNSNKQILLQKFPGFGNKKVNEIYNQLIQAKNKPLRRLLNGLGIGHVGKKTAIMIVENLIKYYSLQDQDLSPLENLTKHITDPDFLNSIVGIGQKTVQEIIDFMNNKNNLEILKKLEQFGVNFDPIQYYKDKENIGIFEGLNNGSFSITGTFPISREAIVQEMQKHGRTFHENPKKDTEIILVGEQAGSKKAKAQELQISIVEGRSNIIQEFSFLQNIINQDKSSNKFSNKPTSQHSLF